MITPLIIFIWAVVFLGAMSRGLRWAFAWMYVPVLVLIPSEIRCNLPGLTELNAAGAAGLALLGALILRREHENLSWQWFDLLAILPVLTFAISYGQSTGVVGGFHRFRLLVCEWTFPYLFTRFLIRDADDLRVLLRPLAFSSLALGFLAIYECRMALRLAPLLWSKIGIEITNLDHFGGWRWGYLRAAASMGHPLSLGRSFPMSAPLMLLASVWVTKSRWLFTLAVLACVAGTFSSLSRGPILVLVIVLLLPGILSSSRQIWIPVLLVVAIVAAPSFMDVAKEEVERTETQMKRVGNTTSGHYRVALLLIYGRQITEVGLWGDAKIQAHPEFQHAWSIDNAYLYLFLTGGWLGGGAFCAIILTLLYQGVRHVLRLPSGSRRLYAMVLGSLVGVAGCMGNVWFAADYAPFFWMACALVHNLVWRDLAESSCSCETGMYPVDDVYSPEGVYE